MRANRGSCRDRQKEHIKSLRSSVKRLQRQCERQELGNEERHAFEINVVLAQETGKTIRAYIEQHQDIKIIFNSDAPVSTLFVGTGTSSQSSSASAGAGSQPSSRASNVPTPDTSLAAESSRSPGGSEVSHGHEDVLAKADDQSNEDFWVPRRHLDAIEPWPRSSRPRFPTPRPHDGNDNVVERDDRPVIRGRHYPHQRFPPIRPLRLEQRLRFPEDRPAAPLPQTPDGPAQDVVVDRDDGLGPRNEYRPPRKPRRPPNPKT